MFNVNTFYLDAIVKKGVIARWQTRIKGDRSNIVAWTGWGLQSPELQQGTTCVLDVKGEPWKKISCESNEKLARAVCIKWPAKK